MRTHPLVAEFQRQVSGTHRITDLQNAFWRELDHLHTPLMEQEGDFIDVTFVWQSSRAQHVIVNSWLVDWFNPALGAMKHIPNTDVWHLTVRAPADILIQYRIAEIPKELASTLPMSNLIDAEGPVWKCLQYDPRSIERHAYSDEPGYTVSLLRGPRAPVPHVEQEHDGHLIEADITSPRTSEVRTVFIWMPKTAERELAFVASFDGRQLLRPGMNTAAMLARTPPRIAAFLAEPTTTSGRRKHEIPAHGRLVHPSEITADSMIERDRELTDPQQLARTIRFIGEDFVPAVRDVISKWGYSMTSDRRHHTISGLSQAGKAALMVARQYPQQYGNVIALSPSLWSNNGSLLDELTRNPFHPDTTVVLRAGRYETGMHELENPERFRPSIREYTSRLAHILQYSGVPVVYDEYTGGHDGVHFVEGMRHGLQHIDRQRRTADRELLRDLSSPLVLEIS